MKLKHCLLVAALAMTASEATTVTRAQAQGFSDTSIGIRDSAFVANPGEEKGGRNVNKIIVNVGHFDVWDCGSNFINVDILFSNANEPANNSAGGSTEFYAVYRGQFSPDKIFGINTKIGPFDAINFEIGGDAEGENTQFAPAKRLLVAGPNFHVALPAGFLTIGVHISKEWNNNGFSNCPNACFVRGGPVDFNATPEFEIVCLYPLAFTNLPLDFRGFANFVLPKGRDGFGNQTVTEILARPQFQLDIGKVLSNKPHKPDLYLAVELWDNKFGNNHSKVPGSQQVAPTIGIEYHF
jgi:nucleoside-specific outer membrane channel protein Tsx